MAAGVTLAMRAALVVAVRTAIVALAVAFTVMAAHNIGVKAEAARCKIGNSLVGTAVYAAEKLNTCLRKCVFGTAANAAADKHINTVLL